MTKMSDNKSNGLEPQTGDIEALAQRGYVIGKKIGQGSYATVHITDYNNSVNEKHQVLACKIFNKNRAPQDFLKNFFPRELEILTKLENPHVIQVHSILQRGPRVFIFMRYAENGDLLEFIKKHGPVSETNAKEWFRQMVSGLKYLHNNQIAHRDLKCENVLLSKRYNVKLADFGFARYCTDKDGHNVLSQTYCGSAAYAAPEVVSGIPYDPKMADIWSLGVILYIMLNAAMPFDDSNLKTLLKDQLHRKWNFRSVFRSSLSHDAKSIVHRLLEPNLMMRLGMDQILEHNWVYLHPSEQSNSTVHSWIPGEQKTTEPHSSPARRLITEYRSP